MDTCLRFLLLAPKSSYDKCFCVCVGVNTVRDLHDVFSGCTIPRDLSTSKRSHGNLPRTGIVKGWCGMHPVDTRRNNNILIASKRRRNVVIMTLLLCHVVPGNFHWQICSRVYTEWAKSICFKSLNFMTQPKRENLLFLSIIVLYHILLCRFYSGTCTNTFCKSHD